MLNSKVVWTSGKQFVAESGSGHAFVLDASSDFPGGRNTGARPTEMVLVGLAGCTAVDVAYILEDRMHKTISTLEVDVSAERANAEPKVFTLINVKFEIAGPGLAEKDVRRAISLSSEKYCSVSVMLAKTARILVSYLLTDTKTGATVAGEVEHG